MSPADYLKEKRLIKAKELLENSVFETVTEVSYQVGFLTPNIFLKFLKKNWRKSLRNIERIIYIISSGAPKISNKLFFSKSNNTRLSMLIINTLRKKIKFKFGFLRVSLFWFFLFAH